MAKEHWKDEPEEHDFAAAADYLRLVLPERSIEWVVEALRSAPPVEHKAKDLLRASGLPLLPPDDPHVADDLEKARDGRKLSPVLLVRGDLPNHRPLTVADGYHRICASFHLDVSTQVPCRSVELVAADRPSG